jgi:hypothetical protein
VNPQWHRNRVVANPKPRSSPVELEPSKGASSPMPAGPAEPQTDIILVEERVPTVSEQQTEAGEVEGATNASGRKVEPVEMAAAAADEEEMAKVRE